MRKRRVLQMPPGVPPPGVAVLWLLLLLLLGLRALAACPPVCTCTPGHREADCSWRGLRQLPDGLQHNLRTLNLSHNRLHHPALDGRLSGYAHLRSLDLSHNRLERLPAALPRSLWELRAAGNRLSVLGKNDTAYQWNLRLLDLSDNRLERAVFINNTLTALRTLDLSRNRFWTVPTNMPARVETVDLSRNSLVQVLAGSLDRMPRLARFYLHDNHFTSVGPGAFGRLGGLRLLSLGGNPWACQDRANISHLLAWLQHTSTRVLGCPCHTQPVCGEARPARTGGWHYGSYTLPPLAAAGEEEELSRRTPPQLAVSAGPWFLSESGLIGTQGHTRQRSSTSTPLSTSARLGLSTTDAATDSLSTADRLSATDRLFVTDRRSTMERPFTMGRPLTPDKPYATDRFSTTEESFTTDHPLTTDAAFTTLGPSSSTRRTATLRTRSVRRPNQPGQGGVRNTGPPAPSSAWSPLQLHLWVLSVTLKVL